MSENIQNPTTCISTATAESTPGMNAAIGPDLSYWLAGGGGSKHASSLNQSVGKEIDNAKFGHENCDLQFFTTSSHQPITEL